mgnify:CR=1 FL=1
MSCRFYQESLLPSLVTFFWIVLNTDKASATIDPVSPVFAGSNTVFVSLASLEKACIYCSASLRATAFSPPVFSIEEATTSMPSAVLTYLIAEMYSPKKIVDSVASTVVLSTFLSFITVPIVVLFSLKYFG